MSLEELQRQFVKQIEFDTEQGHWFLRQTPPTVQVKGIDFEPAVLLWTWLYGKPDSPIRRACGRLGCVNPYHWEETRIKIGRIKEAAP